MGIFSWLRWRWSKRRLVLDEGLFMAPERRAVRLALLKQEGVVGNRERIPHDEGRIRLRND